MGWIDPASGSASSQPPPQSGQFILEQPVKNSLSPEAASQPSPVEEVRESSTLQRFLPQELAAKLEAVRAGGEMAGERRVVTMLFCDIVGSTAAAPVIGEA
jgi:hypothetical protein